MRIISKKDEEFLENVEYFSEIIDRINDIQTDNNYSDEEMDNDLDVALWRAFVYINLWSYKGYAKAEKILKKVENKGIIKEKGIHKKSKKDKKINDQI